MRISGITPCLSSWQLMSLCLILINLGACKKSNLATPQLADIKAPLLAQLNALRLKGCHCGTDTILPVKTVTWNDALEKAAADHAMDMYNKNYFDHISPSGVTPGDWAKMEGYAAINLGEDIAENYDTVDATMTAWENSPEHCTVMMDSAYQDAGAARYGNYWVLLLGKR
jgi:uncharacterized protein YkwD